MGVPNVFVTSTTADASQVNANFTDVETAFSSYRKLVERGNGESGTAGTFFSAASYVLGLQQISTLPAPAAQGFYIDPADFAAGNRTVKLRLRVSFLNNAVATGRTFVFGLYPIATYGGTSGNPPTIASLGTVVTGSTVTFTTPALNTQSHSNSGDFTCPAAAYYTLGLTASGAGASNSYISVRAALQMRQV